MIALSQVLEVIGSIPIPPPLFLLNKKKKIPLTKIAVVHIWKLYLKYVM